MIKYALLGIVQGLTEFLPVSSSGHLAILGHFFGIAQNQVAISVILHLGTLLSLVVFFFNDIIRALKSLRTIWLIIIVTFVTGIIGLSGKDFFEKLFSSHKLAALSLIITGLVLISTKRFLRGERKSLQPKDALILGLTQGAAIIPGISRSGLTISTLLFLKIEPALCFRFSFLASIPAVFGAALLEAKEIDFALKENFPGLLAGFTLSFIFGLFSLWFLRSVLLKQKLHYFGYYCIIAAVITLLFIR
ncbi:MAG: undecaprenyl-diphosphate phosphatase [Candidatus Omnitrophota bacterium]